MTTSPETLGPSASFGANIDTPASAANSEAVAWRWRLKSEPGQSDMDWSYTAVEGRAKGWTNPAAWEVQPLYAQPHPSQQAGTERDEPLEWFLKVVAGGGSMGVPAGDNHSALGVFCDDRGDTDDTYNLSEGLGYTRTTHSGWGDGCATVFITDAGTAFLAALNTSEARG